jgi:hypothetical protein
MSHSILSQLQFCEMENEQLKKRIKEKDKEIERLTLLLIQKSEVLKSQKETIKE